MWVSRFNTRLNDVSPILNTNVQARDSRVQSRASRGIL